MAVATAVLNELPFCCSTESVSVAIYPRFAIYSLWKGVVFTKEIQLE
jgi:hypothetical protein